MVGDRAAQLVVGGQLVGSPVVLVPAHPEDPVAPRNQLGALGDPLDDRGSRLGAGQIEE